jgi:tellurite resistance protein
MIYIGSPLRNHINTKLSCEVIDPWLQIDPYRPDISGAGMDYWPAYHSIPAGSRAAYLSWLAGGRCQQNTYIGYVFLFFYGLERRALVDAQKSSLARADLPYIYAEVNRLLQIYGTNRSFRSYATKFQEALELMLSDVHQVSLGPPPDPMNYDSYEPPFTLKVGLGKLARAAKPIPVDWAFSWAMLHPEIYPRTAVRRCPEEFRRLFTMRYHEQHGAGLIVQPVKRSIPFSYHPASAAIRGTSVTVDLPDVLNSAVPTRKLKQLVNSCTDALDAYSRLLGRQPTAGGTLAALALLPPELLDDSCSELLPIRKFVAQYLSEGVPHALVDTEKLTALWPRLTPGKFVKADAVGLAQLLGQLGIGMEPDVRLGGPVPVHGPTVLFRTEKDQPPSATAEYNAAMTLLHLAAVVSASDNEVSNIEREHLVKHLESSLHLSIAERMRLLAHLAWLLARDLKLSGLKKRLTALNDEQRTQVAEFVTIVAAIDGQISPSEVVALRKIYTVLSLDPDLVYSRLHLAASKVAVPLAAHEPVTVIDADATPSGYLIPRNDPPASKSAGLALDSDLIEAKLRESAAVSTLLADIFADDAASEALEPPTPTKMALFSKQAKQPIDLVASLDPAHSTLLRRMAERPVWSRAEFEELCTAVHLLPAGALETLNESALVMADEPVIEDSDENQLQINNYALRELIV